MCKISVIVPVYNVEKYLEECINSLRNQTLSDIEIIAIDDGSPDNCGKILDMHAKLDYRIKVIHKKNAGVSAARNDGINKASGEYLFFCDSDDWLEKEALEKMYKCIKKYNSDIVITDFQENNGQSAKIHHMFSDEFTVTDADSIKKIQMINFPKGYTNISTQFFSKAYCIAAPWHHLIRKDIIKQNNLYFDTDVRGMYDDGLFMLSVFEYVKKISYLKIVTYNYRVVSSSITHRFNPNILNTYSIVYNKVNEFIKSYNKDSEFIKAFYIRVFAYLNKSMEVYFFHPQNKKTQKEKYQEFCALLEQEPYAQAIKQIKIGDLGNSNSKILLWILRHNLKRLYWFIKRRKYHV